MYIITLAHPSPSAAYPSNSLPTIAHIHTLISTQTEIPLPSLHALDTSLSIVPYHLLLLSQPPGLVRLGDAESSGSLSDKDSARIDLQLGVYLHQLHSIQNDWFGPPLPAKSKPQEPSYNWQETFTLLLEDLLRIVEHDHQNIDIPYADFRKYLSRAIGSYLFEDVEVPSLVWVTGCQDDILISCPDESTEPKIEIVTLAFAHGIWGDPLLECIFLPPGPSQAVLEGYGEPLIKFPRQKTKRMWYTVYLLLVVLVERDGDGELDELVMEALSICAEQLKDAPCY